MIDCLPNPIFLVRQRLVHTHISTSTYRGSVTIRSEAESHEAALVQRNLVSIYLINALVSTRIFYF